MDGFAPLLGRARHVAHFPKVGKEGGIDHTQLSSKLNEQWLESAYPVPFFCWKVQLSQRHPSESRDLRLIHRFK